MRKTSQDGGDTTSITSGVENEIKKTGAIIKTKRNSIKRKVQSLSHESDDAVIEPLLQKDKEKTDTINQSAKFNLLPKTKTDIKNERKSDKSKLLQENKAQDSLLSDTQKDVNAITPIFSSNIMPKYIGAEAPLHNHMNTNVFNSPDALKGFITSKSQVLVEIDASKQSGLSSSPLIFTTAKIHTNDKTEHMEPLQVTPVPILSTIEVSILKGTRHNNGESSGSVTSSVSTIPVNIPNSNKNIPEKVQNLKTSTFVPEAASKRADIKDFSDKNQLTQGNKILAADSAVIKDLKKESKLPLNNPKDTSLGDSNYTNNEEKNEIDGKRTKISLYQDLSSSSSDQIKSNVTSAVCKSMNTPVTAKVSSANYATKQVPNDKTAQKMKTDKANVLKTSEPETDLNKNMKAGDSWESNQSEIYGNKSGATCQAKLGSNTSASNKHLQRQKYAIDKDDTISKLQCSDNMSSLPASKFLIKPHDIGASITKSAIPIQSAANGTNSINNKINLPKSTANDVHITSSISNKLLSGNTIFETSANKSATSNSFTSVKPIMTPHNTLLPTIKTPIAKVTDISTTLSLQSSSNNVIISGSGGKSTGSNLSMKPQTSIITNKPLTSVASSAKTTNVATADISSVLPKQTVTKTNVTNTPSGTINNLTEIVVKNPSVGTSTAKIPSVSTSTAKTHSLPTCTTKSLSVSTTSPVSISDTKNSSLPAISAKVSKVKTVSTTAINSPPLLTNTAKNSTGSKDTVKVSLVSTSSATGPTASITTERPSNVPTISTASHQVTSSSILTSGIPASTTDSTSKALQSHKSSQEFTNGNKSLNA